MPKQIYFERAIFLSWYCGKGDCKFCYMSTQKNRIKNPRLARRTKHSIIVEVLLCRLFNWKIEFLSGGYESYSFDELEDLVKCIYEAYGRKLWLNMGVLSENELRRLSPYLEGVSGAVECITPKLRDEICPSKPLFEIENMFRVCDKLGLKKSMTLILGLGETISDFAHLKKFIENYNVSQITFYRLKPQKNTSYENAKPIERDYYAQWIILARKAFPEIRIIVGSWLTHLDEISYLLLAGADGITKFPSVEKFGSKYAKQIEKEVKKAGMAFKSNLTEKINMNIQKEVEALPFGDKLKQLIASKLKDYLDTMN